jgi:hypothetical protein
MGLDSLSLNLTRLRVRGKAVAIHTIAAFQPQDLRRRHRSRLEASRFALPSGSVLEFRLAQAIDF